MLDPMFPSYPKLWGLEHMFLDLSEESEKSLEFPTTVRLFAS